MSDETRGVVIVPKWTSAAWWNDLDCVTVTYWDQSSASSKKTDKSLRSRHGRRECVSWMVLGLR